MTTWVSQLLLPWQTLALKKDLQWESQIPVDLPTLLIDPGRMAQAVENLLNNAIKYTPAGGRVAVAAGVESEQVYIKIRDTGAGIPAAEQELVFTPFYRGQSNRRFSQGLGLGLSIASDLIHAQRGRLVVQSNADQGTVFTVWLPV